MIKQRLFKNSWTEETDEIISRMNSYFIIILVDKLIYSVKKQNRRLNIYKHQTLTSSLWLFHQSFTAIEDLKESHTASALLAAVSSFWLKRRVVINICCMLTRAGESKVTPKPEEKEFRFFVFRFRVNWKSSCVQHMMKGVKGESASLRITWPVYLLLQAKMTH